MRSHAPTTTVVQICGAGHSGSTLLGLVLGSHPESIYLGEAKKARYVGDPTKPARKRACKFCGDDSCPVWGYRWTDDEQLYAVMAERTGRRVQVDSTKGIGWLEKRAAEVDALGMRRVVLFLQRDGRAIVNSRLRKYPDRSVDDQIAQWVEQIEGTRDFYEAQAVPKRVVRYEEFASTPEKVVRELCALIGMAYAPQMLRFEEVEHHVLGGNNGTQFLVARGQQSDARVEVGPRHGDYYKKHDRGIRLDLRWKRELPSDVLDRFEARAGELNAPMAWEVK